MNKNANNWYYVEKGKQVGPFSFQEVKSLVADRKINEETSVWNGEGDWKPAKNTVLFDLFKIPLGTPPPLTGADVDNKYVWLVVVVPLVGLIIELIVSQELVWIYLVLNIVLCVLDEHKLRSAGYETPNRFWVFLIPVYLWKRAGLLKQKKYYFLGWIVAFILSIFLTTRVNQSIIEEYACPVVTQIIQEQFGGQATCKAVRIDEEVIDGFYRATAILDNGNVLQITIEEKENNQIYVQIPLDQ